MRASSTDHVRMHITLPLVLSLLAPLDPPEGTVRVLDATTGAPVEGATVYGVKEAVAPVWGEFWSQTSAETDASGWAKLQSLDQGTHYSWIIVRAEGYAPAGRMADPFPNVELDPIELCPALPATIRIVDYLGRPAQLVHLGFCVGCRHTPDVMSAVTDRNGVVVLSCVGRDHRDIADIYPVADGVLTDYLHIDWNQAIDGGYEAVVAPGVTVSGRLFKADGSPAAGYAVGQPRVHRGPWARTNEDGTFRLYGMEPAGDIHLIVKGPDGLELAHFEGARAGVERILRLPEQRYGDTGPSMDAEIALTVTVPPTEGVAPVPVPGQVWDPRTGWCTSFEATPGETLALALPSGLHEIEIGGGSSPYARRTAGRMDLGADGGPLALSVELPPVRVVRLEVEGVDADSDLFLLTEDGECIDVVRDTHETRDGVSFGIVERVALPAEPFGLWQCVQEKGVRDAVFEIDGLLEDADVLRAKRR
jgi:hypothetical protein